MTYTITVTESPVCIAHQLSLPYESKCNQLHGHNYTVEAVITAQTLNSEGMVADFSHIKDVIKKYDHSFIGDMSKTVWNSNFYIENKIYEHISPSTAEMFAAVLFKEIEQKLTHTAKLVSVSVWETPSSKVTVCS